MSSEDTFTNAIHFEGEDKARKLLVAWLEKYHESGENEGGLEIEVYHFVAGNMAEEEPFVFIDFDLALSSDQLARKIVAACIDYCDNIESGKVRFLCKVDGVKGKVIFPITVPEREDGDEVDEAPNAVGMTMQQMRHNEKLINVNVKAQEKATAMFEAATVMYKDMLQNALDRVKQLEGVHIDTIKTYEELNAQSHLRALEFRKLEKQEKRMDQVAGVLMQGAPHLFNKLLGGPLGMRAQVVNEGWTPLETMLMGFAGTLTKEHLDKIVSSGIFDQTQIMGLVQLLSALQEKHEAEEKKSTEAGAPPQAQSSNGSTNGAAQHKT